MEGIHEYIKKHEIMASVRQQQLKEEKRRLQSRAWYAKNKERVNALRREWIKNNPEKAKAIERERYQKHLRRG